MWRDGQRSVPRSRGQMEERCLWKYRSVKCRRCYSLLLSQTQRRDFWGPRKLYHFIWIYMLKIHKIQGRQIHSNYYCSRDKRNKFCDQKDHHDPCRLGWGANSQWRVCSNHLMGVCESIHQFCYNTIGDQPQLVWILRWRTRMDATYPARFTWWLLSRMVQVSRCLDRSKLAC